ncbi:MAG: hypothetical protein KKC20_25690 [Proteobacteria bacterium]|jgi:hypothetical protein|nr:hypothetical protein [Pseudomonadota bacterium]
MYEEKQLGSYFRYLRMGYGTTELAYITGLSEEKIFSLDTYLPVFNIGMVVRLSYGLGVGLREVMKASLMPISFMECNNTQLGGEQYIVRNADLVRFLECVPENIKKAKEELEGRGFSELTKEISEVVKQRADGELASVIVNQYIEDSTHRKELFSQGSVFCEADFKTCLRFAVRKAGGHKRLCKVAGVTPQNLVGLFTQELVNTNFIDVLRADKAASLRGELVSIYWKAAEYQTGIVLNPPTPYKNKEIAIQLRRWTQPEKLYADWLMNIYRQFRGLLPERTSWLSEILDTSKAEIDQLCETQDKA